MTEPLTLAELRSINLAVESIRRNERVLATSKPSSDARRASYGAMWADVDRTAELGVSALVPDEDEIRKAERTSWMARSERDPLRQVAERS